MSERSILQAMVGTSDAERLSLFAYALREALPDDITDVLLFGSRARGTPGPDSDWDVAILITDADRRAEVRKWAGGLAARMSGSGFHLSPLVIPAPGGLSKPSSWRVRATLAGQIAAQGIQIL